jgi:hypothetical protein
MKKTLPLLSNTKNHFIFYLTLFHFFFFSCSPPAGTVATISIRTHLTTGITYDTYFTKDELIQNEGKGWQFTVQKEDDYITEITLDVIAPGVFHGSYLDENGNDLVRKFNSPGASANSDPKAKGVRYTYFSY